MTMLSQFVSILSWVSLFAQTWLALLGNLNETPVGVRFFSFIFFLAMAFLSSVSVAAQEKQMRDFIVQEMNANRGK